MGNTATIKSVAQIGLMAGLVWQLVGCGESLSPSRSVRGSVVPRGAASDNLAFLRQQADPVSYRFNRELMRPMTVCGKNELQQINHYDGQRGEPVAFARLHKYAVGAMTDGNLPTAQKYCSGTLVGPDLFITAGHCVDARTIGEYVVFNYEKAPGSDQLLPQDFYRIKESVEVGGAFDYAIIRLDGNPGNKWGWAPLRTRQVETNELLTIIQHPAGEPKQIDVGHVTGFSGNYLTYGDVDTEPGSSGSGILDAHGNLIGIHTNGGCTQTGGVNSGVRLNAAAAQPVVAKLAAKTLPFTDGTLLQIGLPGTGTNGKPLALVADPAAHNVSLGQEGATATSWRVVDFQDGSFSFMVSGQGTETKSAVLDGLTGTAAVSLVEATTPSDLGTKWQVMPADNGQMQLRAVGQVDGSPWLAGNPGGSENSVALADQAGPWTLAIKGP